MYMYENIYIYIYVIQSSFIWKTKCQYFYGRGKKCIKEQKRGYTKLDAELFS